MTIFSRRPSADFNFFSQWVFRACPRSYKAIESSRSTSPCSRRETMASNSLSAPSKLSSSMALPGPLGDCEEMMKTPAALYDRFGCPKPPQAHNRSYGVPKPASCPRTLEIIVQERPGTSSFLARGVTVGSRARQICRPELKRIAGTALRQAGNLAQHHLKGGKIED